MRKRIVRFECQGFLVVRDGLVPGFLLRKLDGLLGVTCSGLSRGQRCEEEDGKQTEHHCLTAYQSTREDDAFPANQSNARQPGLTWDKHSHLSQVTRRYLKVEFRAQLSDTRIARRGHHTHSVAEDAEIAIWVIK